MTYPILEHDPIRTAFIEPSKVNQARDMPEHCVICFFKEVIDKVVAELGQVLYGGDDLSGAEWDNRAWQSRDDIRERLFWLSAEACLAHLSWLDMLTACPTFEPAKYSNFTYQSYQLVL